MAFWAAVVDHFPTAESGDFDIGSTIEFRRMAVSMIAQWVHWNVPEGVAEPMQGLASAQDKSASLSIAAAVVGEDVYWAGEIAHVEDYDPDRDRYFLTTETGYAWVSPEELEELAQPSAEQITKDVPASEMVTTPTWGGRKV